MKKLLSTIATSAILSTSIFADAATDAAIAALMAEMGLSVNTPPTVTATQSSQSVNTKDGNKSVIYHLSKSDVDGDSVSLVIAPQNGDVTATLSGDDLNISLSSSVVDGTSVLREVVVTPNDGKDYGTPITLKTTFTNPLDIDLLPEISSIDNQTFSSNGDNSKTITFDTNESNESDIDIAITNLSIDNNNTNLISASFLDNKNLKITRLKASAGSVNIQINGVNSKGLSVSEDFNITIEELAAAPSFSLDNKNITIYIDENVDWEENVTFNAYDYNGNFTKFEFPAKSNDVNASMNPATPVGVYVNVTEDATNDKFYEGNITISGENTGTFYVDLKATDDTNKTSATQRINISVTNANKAPVLTLPFTTISELTQGDSKTKTFTLYDENDALSTLDINMSVIGGGFTTEANTTTTDANGTISVSDGYVKFDLNRDSKSITATTLQDNDGVTYTVTLVATDTKATSSSPSFTLTTQSADTALINSLIPVQIKDYVNGGCNPMFYYPDINMSDSFYFKLDYRVDDTIHFTKFDFNETTDLSSMVLDYYSQDQLYGAKSDDNTTAVAIKFEISQAGQFSGGRMMCVVTDANTSNQTCWALATPEQKLSLENYEAGHCQQQP